MTDKTFLYLAYQKDFSECGNDRYFIYDGIELKEVLSDDIVTLDCFVVTHDFWLISNSLFNKHSCLPSKIIDIVLLSKIIAGVKSTHNDTQPWDISKTIRPLFKPSNVFKSYMDIYYRRKDFDINIYREFLNKLSDYFNKISSVGEVAGEMERFYDLELPIYNSLTLSTCKGIRVNTCVIKAHKNSLKTKFYRQLKEFAQKHNVLYELPSGEDIKEKLTLLGYNVQDYSTNFLINFLPSHDNFSLDLRNLKKTNMNFRLFNSFSSRSKRLRPIVESHWTSTSRIYYKSPSLQNISRRYRDIFIPDKGMSLCYVDYDQFEVGIMAALSSDPKMRVIYENYDTYEDFALHVFKDKGMRNISKKIFLSYTYGMSIKNILKSVAELKGNTKNAIAFFNQFPVFDAWKESIIRDFLANNRIATISANYLNRNPDRAPTDKEKRTAVNHVIQGSASYIFKKVLLEISKINDVQILIPMHDAVLFQHTPKVAPISIVKIFKDVMTRELSNKISGKASIVDFNSRIS